MSPKTKFERATLVRHSRKIGAALTAAVLLWATVPGLARSQAGVAVSPMRALQQARRVPEGSSHPSHIIYVFMDPNCPYCHALWLALKPYYGQGLQVREILVGVISASSAGKAAAILDASDPSAALRGSEERWGQGPDRGADIAPLAQPSTRDLNEIESNEALMLELGIRGTPGLVFASAQGKVYVFPGMPQKSELGQIVRTATVPRSGGLMSQKARAR